MKTTEQRIREWLADPANIRHQYPAIFQERGFEFSILRNRFVTTNGIEISIQQGATHYCDAASVEMWCCPHRPILDPYGDGGENPYGWVPLDVVAQYVDELEGESNDQDRRVPPARPLGVLPHQRRRVGHDRRRAGRG